MTTLTIALSKGRILKQTLPILKNAGFEISDDAFGGRKLIVGTNFADVRFVIIRAKDVPIFVQHGVADIGFTGKDVLLEHGGEGLFEMLDLKIAKCRMVVAAQSENALDHPVVKVATKYVRSAKKYFAGINQPAEIIRLAGAIELAPLVGLSHCIVDLAATGATLKANGLIPVREILKISTRVVVNRSAFKTRREIIRHWLEIFENSR